MAHSFPLFSTPAPGGAIHISIANIVRGSSRHQLLQDALELVFPKGQAQKLRSYRVLVAHDDLVIVEPVGALLAHFCAQKTELRGVVGLTLSATS